MWRAIQCNLCSKVCCDGLESLEFTSHSSLGAAQSRPLARHDPHGSHDHHVGQVMAQVAQQWCVKSQIGATDLRVWAVLHAGTLGPRARFMMGRVHEVQHLQSTWLWQGWFAQWICVLYCLLTSLTLPVQHTSGKNGAGGKPNTQEAGGAGSRSVTPWPATHIIFTAAHYEDGRAQGLPQATIHPFLVQTSRLTPASPASPLQTPASGPAWPSSSAALPPPAPSPGLDCPAYASPRP